MLLIIILLGLAALGLAGFGLFGIISFMVSVFWWLGGLLAAMGFMVFMVFVPLYGWCVRGMIRGETPRIKNKHMWLCLGIALLVMVVSVVAPIIWGMNFYVCYTRLNDPDFDGMCFCTLIMLLLLGLFYFMLGLGLLVGALAVRLALYRRQRKAKAGH